MKSKLKGAFKPVPEDDYRWIELDEGVRIHARFVSDERSRKLATKSATTRRSIRRSGNREDVDTVAFLKSLIEFAIDDWDLTYKDVDSIVELTDDFKGAVNMDNQVPFTTEDCFMVARRSSAFTDALLEAVRDPKNFVDVPRDEEEEEELEEDGPDPTPPS